MKNRSNTSKYYPTKSSDFAIGDSHHPQVWSGADVKILFTVPDTSLSYGNTEINLSTVQLQTITMSSTSSIYPVRRIGEAKAHTYTRGSRTFAGSMVFSIIGNDPLQNLFSIDAINNSFERDGHWFIDSMPAIDCIIMYANESGGAGIQIIQDLRFSNWGQTVSIDDMYLESTYTYVAEHVTPFVSYDPSFSTASNTVIEQIGEMLRKNASAATPDKFIVPQTTQPVLQTELNTLSDFLNAKNSSVFLYHL